MSIADVKYKELINKIYEEGVWDKGEKVRTKWKDGTPAYTKSIFGVQVEFEEDELPILTNKKVFWKTALKEMMLFWQKQTVQAEDFKEANVKVWDEWFKNGNLGRSYAYQFESHRHHERNIVEVKPKQVKNKPSENYFKVGEELEVEKNHSMCGQTFSHETYGDYKIISYNKETDRFLIQFIQTKYSYSAIREEVLRNSVRDPYVKTHFNGHGTLGLPKKVKNVNKKSYEKLLRVWQNILERCYNKDSKDYEMYGGRGIFVESRWQCFEFFLRDMFYVPQFFLAEEGGFDKWELDKDYFSSNCYSLETCVWLRNSDNCIYRKQSKPIILTDKRENEHLYLTIEQEAKDFNFDSGEGSKYLRGKSKALKGYHLEYESSYDYPLRYELSRNQVVELINNIQTNSQSRRLMTNFYNHADMDKKNLVECAYGTTWNVKNGKLDLILSQRSGDIGLGIPFNWIQYRLLQFMIAQATGLKVGRFIHQIANLHYYERHEKTLLEQIERENYEQPEIWINPKINDFFDFTPKDIQIKNYTCGEVTPMEVAI